MKKEIVGFVGCYSHDVILMLAKTATAMERRVLVLDRNRSHTLGASVPIPPGVSVKEKVVEYDGFFFSERELEAEILANYDLILMDFGVRSLHEDVSFCTQIFLVTDMLLHHIRQLQKLSLNKVAVKRILIRDAVGGVKSGTPELRELLEQFSNRKEYFLPPDRRDIRNRYVCETFHEYQVKHASPELREFIYDVVREWCAEMPEREFWKKIKRQERRGYA
ncbi:MAG: hypothetical protein IJW37_06000 [Lachnospiraceae bacterium]|nr:hypothetical protein [Lachnospiraceae bacterium]